MFYYFNFNKKEYTLDDQNDIEINNAIFDGLYKLWRNDYAEIHYNICHRLMNKIWELRKVSSKYKPEDTEGVSVRTGSFKFYIYPKIYTLYYQLYNFREKKYYDEYKDSVKYTENFFDKETNTFYVSIYAISGVIKSSIEHFINKSLFPNLNSDYNSKYESLYTKLVLNYMSGIQENTIDIIRQDENYKPIYNDIEQFAGCLKKGVLFKKEIENIAKVVNKAQIYANVINDIDEIYFGHEHVIYTKDYVRQIVCRPDRIRINKPEYYVIFYKDNETELSLQ